jgi:MFS family permease
VAAIVVGTPLTPLNSTMIAVALVQIQSAFSVTLAATSWIISSFYIAAAMGQPLMGRIVDQFGPRRIYCAGLGLVGLSGVLTPLSPSFGFLVACRVLLALGTSSAYPAAMAILRREAGRDGVIPVGALGITSIAASTTSALGPVVGGFLISSAGWQAIFLVNLPFAILGVVLALSWIPKDATTGPRRTSAQIVRMLDIPGVVSFAGAMTAFLAFLLSLPTAPLWLLAPVAVVLGGAFLWRERRATQPFLDVGMLRRNPALVGVLGQFMLVNVVFYSMYYGLPFWMEDSRGIPPGRVGLLMLPGALISIVMTPIAATLITRFGARRVTIVGSCLMFLSCVMLLSLSGSSQTWLILTTVLMFGLPNSLNNLSLQSALYAVAPRAHTGAAAGMYQSCRYIGAILASTVSALIAGPAIDSRGLHRVAAVIVSLSVVLVIMSTRLRAESAGGEPLARP